MISVTTTPKKRWFGIVLVALFAILELVVLVHDFITNDPVHYFAEQPGRLLLVAAIAITGGLVVFLFNCLSPGSKRSVKLFALGSVASCLTMFLGVFLLEFTRLWSVIGPLDGSWAFILVPLCLGLLVVLLWWEFSLLFKERAPGSRFLKRSGEDC